MNRFVLLIGIAVILGSIGGRIFARLRIPQVVGPVAIGICAILVGGAWFHAISAQDIQRLEPISFIGLAILASHRLTYGDGHTIVLVITATTFLRPLEGSYIRPSIAAISMTPCLAFGNGPAKVA